MGRPSKLTEKQWADVDRRLLAGEKSAALAKEYGVDRAAIARRNKSHVEVVKSVANQVLAAEDAFKSLPISQRIATTGLIDELRSVSMHLAGAAKYGAATAHRLSGIAHNKVIEIDDAAPLNDESMESLKGIAVLTRMANDASQIGVNLLAANKDMLKEQANSNEIRITGGLPG